MAKSSEDQLHAAECSFFIGKVAPDVARILSDQNVVECELPSVLAERVMATVTRQYSTGLLFYRDALDEHTPPPSIVLKLWLPALRCARHRSRQKRCPARLPVWRQRPLTTGAAVCHGCACWRSLLHVARSAQVSLRQQSKSILGSIRSCKLLDWLAQQQMAAMHDDMLAFAALILSFSA